MCAGPASAGAGGVAGRTVLAQSGHESPHSLQDTREPKKTWKTNGQTEARWGWEAESDVQTGLGQPSIDHDPGAPGKAGGRASEAWLPVAPACGTVSFPGRWSVATTGGRVASKPWPLRGTRKALDHNARGCSEVEMSPFQGPAEQ